MDSQEVLASRLGWKKRKKKDCLELRWINKRRCLQRNKKTIEK